MQLEHPNDGPPRTQLSSEETYLKLVQNQARTRISQDMADWQTGCAIETQSGGRSFSGDYLYFHPTYSVLLRRMSWEPKLLLAWRRSTCFQRRQSRSATCDEWGSQNSCSRQAAATLLEVVFSLPFGPDVGCVACQKAGPREVAALGDSKPSSCGNSREYSRDWNVENPISHQ